MPGEAIDLAFEVQKIAGQRAALLDANGAQFRERALGDALANGISLDSDFVRLDEAGWIGLSGRVGNPKFGVGDSFARSPAKARRPTRMDPADH